MFDPDVLQEKYRRWLALSRELEAATQTWREARALLAELSAYYESEQWRADYESGRGTRCEGEYSILGEDTLFDAFQEQYSLALDWMRLGLDYIDRQGAEDGQA